MNTNDLSIDELVSLKVKEELSKYQGNYRRVSDGWVELRKEIDTYIREEMREQTKMSYTTCQNSIYGPIKIIIGVSRVDMMTNEQARIARDIYKYVQAMVRRYNKRNESSKGA